MANRQNNSKTNTPLPQNNQVLSPRNSKPVQTSGVYKSQIQNNPALTDPLADSDFVLMPQVTEPIDMTPPLPANLMSQVLGDSGTMRYSGYLQEEFNNAWRDGFVRVETVEVMRRTDEVIMQGLDALKAPILAANWDVECGSDDPQDLKAEEWIRQNLFEQLRRPWKDFLSEAFTYFDFGHSAFEKIFEIREDGNIWLADLEPRIQRSIQRWKLPDKTRGIVQYIRTDETDKFIANIPMSKLAVFTNLKEGDDITGRSVLRTCYRAFLNKDALIRIASISAERYGCGIPIVRVKKGSSVKEQNAAYTMGQNIRTSEKASIVLVGTKDDIDLDILIPKGKGAGSEIKDYLDIHNRAILNAMMAGFLNLGSTDTGSFALSTDQHSFFLTHVTNKCSYFAEAFTKQVITELLAMNHIPYKKVPKLVYKNLGEKDLLPTAQWIAALAPTGAIKIDSRMIEWTHQWFGLPPITEDDMTSMQISEVNDQISSLESSTAALAGGQQNQPGQGQPTPGGASSGPSFAGESSQEEGEGENNQDENIDDSDPQAPKD